MFAASLLALWALVSPDPAPEIDERGAATIDATTEILDNGTTIDAAEPVVPDVVQVAPKKDRRGVATVRAVPVLDARSSPPVSVPIPVSVDDSPARIVEPPAPPSPPPSSPPPSSHASPSTESTRAEDFSFSGIPAVNYVADNGLGLGLLAAGYWSDGRTLPYRTAVMVQLFATSKLVQDSHVTVDALRVLDLPLRLGARAGFLASLTQNYCGEGGDVTCDETTARRAAAAAGLENDDDDDDDDWDRFVRRYYQRRFLNPYAFVQGRYALLERGAHQPLRVELTAGYRASYFVPGTIFFDEDGDGTADLRPYAGSLYASVYPDGEPGLSSLVSLGVMFDSRDREPSPTRGWWTEASVRATTPGLSSWSYAGFHVTVRGFTPVSWAGHGLDERVVLAHRLVFDGIVGDAPVQDLARLGGSLDTYAFGGADVGRGIRVQRYLGALKVLDQAELRWRFAEWSALGQTLAFTAVGFLDTGLVGDRLFAPRHVGVAAGGGAALRVAWNENFVIRCDVAVSPVEAWAPQTYLTVGQPF
jgi:hypothetical protein